mgnify:CR=1 FL=1
MQKREFANVVSLPHALHTTWGHLLMQDPRGRAEPRPVDPLTLFGHISMPTDSWGGSVE